MPSDAVGNSGARGGDNADTDAVKIVLQGHPDLDDANDEGSERCANAQNGQSEQIDQRAPTENLGTQLLLCEAMSDASARVCSPVWPGKALCNTSCGLCTMLLLFGCHFATPAAACHRFAVPRQDKYVSKWLCCAVHTYARCSACLSATQSSAHHVCISHNKVSACAILAQ